MIELVPIVSTFDLKISYACCLVGQEIVAGDDLYGGSNHFLSEVVRKKGIMVTSVSCPFFLKICIIFKFCAVGNKNSIYVMMQTC